MRHIHVTGLVLTVGSILFLIGAGLPPEPMRVFSAPRMEHLDIIHRNRARWGWMNKLMTAGIMVTAIGLLLFAQLLGSSTGPIAGSVAYIMGGVLWILALNFRDTATIHAAGEAAETGSIPNWLEPLEAWAGRMFWIYMFSAYLAIAAFGWCLVRTSQGPVASWMGWFALAYGVVFALAFAGGWPKTKLWGPVAEPPFLVHVPLLVLGIGLVTR